MQTSMGRPFSFRARVSPARLTTRERNERKSTLIVVACTHRPKKSQVLRTPIQSHVRICYQVTVWVRKERKKERKQTNPDEGWVRDVFTSRVILFSQYVHVAGAPPALCTSRANQTSAGRRQALCDRNRAPDACTHLRGHRNRCRRCLRRCHPSGADSPPAVTWGRTSCSARAAARQ